jgi:hypothetical protein
MNQASAIVAMSIIANCALIKVCDHRIQRFMSNFADTVLDHLGGTSAVAKLIEAPISTVHSWRKNGIPQSRMAHLRLAAKDAGIELPAELDELQHEPDPAADAVLGSTGEFLKRASGIAA